ncbi:MAG TPA: TlpA disulfide reductase family protein [Kofleriaceae bacterium]|nr:TlpA disulfide reductase family protein [Kofleriaceae bacterium]
MPRLRTPPALSLAALALALSACRRPPDQPSAVATASPPAAKPAANAELDAGERRAVAVGAHTIGNPGPAITLTTIDGDTIDLGAIYGTRPVYLKFWATWCIPCREQMPGFERTFEAIGDRMTVIAVDTGLDDDVEAVRAFRQRFGLRMPIVVDDGRLAAALDLEVTPQHVLIGRDARIAYVGHHDGEPLDRAIQDVLARPAPSGPVAGHVMTLRPLRPGDVVHGLTATTLDGAAVPLGASPDGRPRALVLFSVWCESYLKDSRPETSQACRRVREAVDELAAHGDVHWLGIAGNLWTSAEDVAEYRTKTATRLPLAFDADGSLLRAFGVHLMPTVVLIDRQGRIARVVGPDERDLAGAVRAVAGTP